MYYLMNKLYLHLALFYFSQVLFALLMFNTFWYVCNTELLHIH